MPDIAVHHADIAVHHRDLGVHDDPVQVSTMPRLTLYANARGMARKLGLAPTEGEDAIHATVLRVMNKPSLIEPDEANAKGDYRPKIWRAVRNHLISLTRRRPHLELSDNFASAAPDEDQNNENLGDLSDLMKAALAALSPRERYLLLADDNQLMAERGITLKTLQNKRSQLTRRLGLDWRRVGPAWRDLDEEYRQTLMASLCP